MSTDIGTDKGIHYFLKNLRASLVDNNGNYIGIGINITRNTKCCNIMFITIHLFGGNTIIES